MTRTIKASGVKPGMEVRWDSGGITYQCKVDEVNPSISSGFVILDVVGGSKICVRETLSVTVLPDPQPEELTEFGAMVIAGGFPALRTQGGADEIDPHAGPWRVRMGRDTWRDLTWDELCSMGPVQVVPDQGWTVPADTPEVPERIEEWDTWEDVPAGVAVTAPGLFCHYRKNQGVVEFSGTKEDPDWTKFGVRYMSRRYGPWTRVTDA